MAGQPLPDHGPGPPPFRLIVDPVSRRRVCSAGCHPVLRCGGMDAQTAVALVSALLATIIAVAVPVMTFRLALRQDAIRWLREGRPRKTRRQLPSSWPWPLCQGSRSDRAAAWS